MNRPRLSLLWHLGQVVQNSWQESLGNCFPHFSRLTCIKHHVGNSDNHYPTRQGPGSLDIVLGESHLPHTSNWFLYLASLQGRHSRGQHDGRQIQGQSQPFKGPAVLRELCTNHKPRTSTSYSVGLHHKQRRKCNESHNLS